MAPEDEAAFLEVLLARPSVYVIPEVRNPTADVPHTRDLREVSSLHCMLWDQKILRRPEVEHIPSCDDYYLRSDDLLLQYLRSPVKEGSIGAGRLAIASEHRALGAWFTALQRWIKGHFKNTFVYASSYQPEVGSRERMVWVGPQAIERSRAGVRLLHSGPAEFALHYFEAAEEAEVLARYRSPRRLLVTGRVTGVGEVVDATTGKQIFGVALEPGTELGAASIEAPFMRGAPEPKIGDEVACVFGENIFGRHAEPWEPREIKKLTAKSRERTLASLRKQWKL